ncbi:MAG: glutamate synthase large subunit [Geminocystis sp.]|nr:glutamate synthase large subunit [Geminocystis sp.]MCX8078363.1 glutamate synthase large subunit [Geminocystis sp.]MDW8116088.1 glutamate synthase large subunit [Geminocystis sp.]HIK38332.1 glutamate synthase large subunit [Geminocystis sp. M7585_C2015_104]
MQSQELMRKYCAKEEAITFQGQPWLTKERDACGVGLIAYLENRQSHELVEKALKALQCMEHRGACGADRDTGDGSGIMTGIPVDIFKPWFAENNVEMPPVGKWAVGMVFLPRDEERAAEGRQYVEEMVAREKLITLGWRKVPINPEVLGKQAKSTLPKIEQIIVTSPDGSQGDELEKRLYIARSRVGKRLTDDFYICSFSSRTIVYKGLVRGEVLGKFYQDLSNPAYTSRWAVFHRRFSTNTVPKWPFAQPMRLIGHNGEINTLLGNINWMKVREANMELPGWTEEELEGTTPIVNTLNSDSYNLDSTLELLVRTGRSIPEALMILIPEAYQNQPELEKYPEIVDFYEYYSGLMEAWDGPALLAFSEGKTVGACLDRNGLRPARYAITRDGCVVVASEAGVVPLPEAEIIEKGKLGPGQMIVVDLENNVLLKNWEIKQKIAAAKPYGQWLKQYRRRLSLSPFTPTQSRRAEEELVRLQTSFGYSAEDLEMIIIPMALEGKEPTFCMGDDIPLAVLSDKPRLLYDYFKQRFAQVTNPAIDPLRESLVMSLEMHLGSRGNLLDVQPESAHTLVIPSPVLSDADLEALKQQSEFPCKQLSTLFPIADGPEGFKASLARLGEEATRAVEEGYQILILSDRVGQIGTEYSYIPPLLAVGAVHHHLIREGLRLKTSLIVDTAQCWSTHHFACLIGYGASAVCPYLTWETIAAWWHDGKTRKLMENGKIEAISEVEAFQRYRKAVEAGLLKILSKMGISLLSSYHGAQIFECIGLGPDVIDLAFEGTTSRVGGLSLAEVANEVISFHQRAFPELQAKKLENYGYINYKKGGEYHMNSPEMAKLLHEAVRAYGTQKGYDHYEWYRRYLEERPATALRDLLEFKSDRQPIPLEEVEPIENILPRFCTGGMSLGALSQEAHETLAIAMNRIGGKSNSGEGGEDPKRYHIINDVDENGYSPSFPHLKGLKNGDCASSAIKQIASGRFGVTPEYLINAEQLEIKIAQGAKPGEGGQLPGKKVSEYIAMLRRSKPGVTLISPPPHHDIYSIEDLAQLIYDLHQINPTAKVSVKLVASVGIGTIAAGVAKANADIIQISGHDGGTGASPLSSIKHAGSPWELGLTEVHRTLIENQLRDRVILRVDGGLRTGWDVVMAALMGAEEYGFGSIAMIAEGCIMARVCHTNQCPVGVATQEERLRKRFPGVPQDVVNFFYLIAEEIRSILAKLGYRSLDEIIGRADLLQYRQSVKLAKTSSLNLDCLLQLPDVKHQREWLNHGPAHSNGHVLDDDILADADIQDAIENHGTVTKHIKIVNTDRSVGARIAGVIARKYGDTGFLGNIQLRFKGTAGQSFGAFNIQGVHLYLEGEANDYVGKGMNGGEIVIVPPAEATIAPEDNVILGNTCLYGATGGCLYANGRAGERFAVRNSKATAVIEGAGDHCCEYMTGGVVVVLGSVGRNVGAGMTGGLAYFLDEEGNFPAFVNPEIVKIQRICTPAAEAQLKQLIANHVQKTGSRKGKLILDNWDEYLPRFWQVYPPSEADSPEVKPQKQLTVV